MRARIFALLLLPAAAWCADWDAAAAARYLDARAAAWAVWPRAAKEGGACVSCHTTLGYLMARPLLRHKLDEAAPTEFEKGLIAGVRVRSAKPPAAQAADKTLVVVDLLALTLDDRSRGAGVSADAEAAFKTIWATQREDGAWGWTNANLEPWEVPESVYFGAALAAVATGVAPDGYQARPDIQPNLVRLKAYLRQNRAGQPLANRLVLLWAAASMDGIVTAAERREILDALWNGQNEDGGWKLGALGPWRDRTDPPPVPAGSSAFATAWASAMLRLAGVKPEDAHLARALTWLRQHQSPEGFWDAASMNHRYEPGSMPELFMRDASTGYAVLALSGGL
jgi:squalene-hopene/tetraprenyl-beta-curcumene cyclase